MYSLIIITLLFLLVCLLFRNKNGLPTNWPIVGMIPALAKNIHRFYNYYIEFIGKAKMTFIFKGPWFTNIRILVTADPNNVHHILCKRPQNYIKGSPEIYEVFGDGIFNSEYNAWKHNQKVAHSFLNHPNFHHSLDHITLEKVENGLIPFLDHASKHQIVFDLQDVLLRFTFDIISMVLVNHDARSLSIGLPSFPVIHCATSILQVIFYRHAVPNNIWKLMRWLNVGIEKSHKQGVKILDDFIHMCINKRLEEMKKELSSSNQGQVRLDLLSFLLMEKNNNIDFLTKSQYNNNNFDKFLRDILANFFLAGGETTSIALTWFFYLLSKNPKVASKIKMELENNMKQLNNGSSIVTNFEELSDQLIYLHAALCETLRLYPPSPLNTKTPIKPDVLPSGHPVTPSTRIVYNVHAMGRMKSIWGDDCNDFKPERWIDEKGMIKHEPAHKFAAFGAGPRSCLGKRMSMTQMKLVAAIIVHKYDIEAIERQHDPILSMVLQMKNGFKVKLHASQ